MNNKRYRFHAEEKAISEKYQNIHKRHWLRLPGTVYLQSVKESAADKPKGKAEMRVSDWKAVRKNF